MARRSHDATRISSDSLARERERGGDVCGRGRRGRRAHSSTSASQPGRRLLVSGHLLSFCVCGSSTFLLVFSMSTSRRTCRRRHVGQMRVRKGKNCISAFSRAPPWIVASALCGRECPHGKSVIWHILQARASMRQRDSSVNEQVPLRIMLRRERHDLTRLLISTPTLRRPRRKSSSSLGVGPCVPRSESAGQVRFRA